MVTLLDPCACQVARERRVGQWLLLRKAKAFRGTAWLALAVNC